MANELDGKKVAFLFTEGAEQIEVTKPIEAVKNAGAEVDIVSLGEEARGDQRFVLLQGHAVERRRDPSRPGRRRAGRCTGRKGVRNAL